MKPNSEFKAPTHVNGIIRKMIEIPGKSRDKTKVEKKFIFIMEKYEYIEIK